MSVFCPQCGAENRDGAVFCSACGTPLPGSGPSANAGPAQQPPQYQQNYAPAPAQQVAGRVPGAAASFLLAMLSGLVFIIPLAGPWIAIVLYSIGIWQGAKAKSSSDLGFVGFVLCIIFLILAILVAIILVAAGSLLTGLVTSAFRGYGW